MINASALPVTKLTVIPVFSVNWSSRGLIRASLRAEYRLTSGAANKDVELNNNVDITAFVKNLARFIKKSRYINRRELNDNYYH